MMTSEKEDRLREGEGARRGAGGEEQSPHFESFLKKTQKFFSSDISTKILTATTLNATAQKSDKSNG
jgi:hypothetical protein